MVLRGWKGLVVLVFSFFLFERKSWVDREVRRRELGLRVDVRPFHKK